MEPNATIMGLNASVNQPTPLILNVTLNQLPQNTWNNWLPLLLFVLGAFLSLLTWGLTEWARRSTKRHSQRTKRYVELIDLIENLMENDKKKPGDPDLKDQFMHQINLCWLHCSDDIIQKTIDMISKFNDDDIPADIKDTALCELMISLRKDIMSTELKHEDYKKIKPAMLRKFVLKAIHANLNATLPPIKLEATAKSIKPQIKEENRKEQ